MPIVSEPGELPTPVLEELVKLLKADLTETLGLIERPTACVRDPASLETAAELLRATLAFLDRPGTGDARRLGADANLAYASLQASIDLLKSHTDLPRVPARRTPPAETSPR